MLTLDAILKTTKHMSSYGEYAKGIRSEIGTAFRVPSKLLCRYSPDLMAGGDDCKNCGRPYEDHV